MASSRETYNVYGHKKGDRAYVSEFLGTVKDYNAAYAKDTAKKEFKDCVVKKIVKKRW